MLEEQWKQLQRLRGFVQSCKYKTEMSAAEKKIKKIWDQEPHDGLLFDYVRFNRLIHIIVELKDIIVDGKKPNERPSSVQVFRNGKVHPETDQQSPPNVRDSQSASDANDGLLSQKQRVERRTSSEA